jgi:hypothetical protein
MDERNGDVIHEDTNEKKVERQEGSKERTNR